jgi:hypothetical protein
MPKPSAARKVTRVARTGGGRTKRGQSSWLFPTVIVVTAVAGTFLIGFSRSERQPNTSPPRVGADHWHAAIGVDICGAFDPNIPDNGQDPLGIHTHGDGIVHIHPFSAQSAGKNATLKVFFDTVGAKITATQIKIPSDPTTHKNGQKCGDKPASVVTKVWDTRASSDTGHIVTGDPGAIHPKNNMLITIAFVPAGTDIPKPPSEPQLDNLSDVGASSTTTVPGPTTVPGSPTSTPASSTPPTSTAPSTSPPASTP